MSTNTIAIVGNNPDLVRHLQDDIPEADIRFVRYGRGEVNIPADAAMIIRPKWSGHSIGNLVYLEAAGRKSVFTRCGKSGIERLIREFLTSSSESPITPKKIGDETMAKNINSRTNSDATARVNGQTQSDLTSDSAAYEVIEDLGRCLRALVEAPIGKCVQSQIDAMTGLLGEHEAAVKAQAEKASDDFAALRKRLDAFDAFRKDVASWQQGLQGEAAAWIASTVRRADLDEIQERVNHFGEELGSLASANHLHHRSLDDRLDQLAARVDHNHDRHANATEQLEQSLLRVERSVGKTVEAQRESIESLVGQTKQSEESIQSLWRRTDSIEALASELGVGAEVVRTRLASLQRGHAGIIRDLAVVRSTSEEGLAGLTTRVAEINELLTAMQGQIAGLNAGLSHLHEHLVQPRGLARLWQAVRIVATRLAAAFTGNARLDRSGVEKTSRGKLAFLRVTNLGSRHRGG